MVTFEEFPKHRHSVRTVFVNRNLRCFYARAFSACRDRGHSSTRHTSYQRVVTVTHTPTPDHFESSRGYTVNSHRTATSNGMTRHSKKYTPTRVSGGMLLNPNTTSEPSNPPPAPRGPNVTKVPTESISRTNQMHRTIRGCRSLPAPRGPNVTKVPTESISRTNQMHRTIRGCRSLQEQ